MPFTFQVDGTCEGYIYGQDAVEKSDSISWAAFHASTMDDTAEDYEPGIAELLPLFRDPAKSPAMVRHAMNITQTAIQHLNPGQTPVICADQPLYIEAKKIQWNWPDIYGEDKYVVLLGGLHIEMNFMKVIGDWLGPTSLPVLKSQVQGAPIHS